MKPKKELGQNFLQDIETIESLVSASDPNPNDVYLEIGPGRGAVTKILAPRVKKVIAVELDADLVPNLQKLSDIINNITIINHDILSYLNSESLILNSEFNKIIGSIPYQITSPLLYSLVKLSLTSSLESATFLIQKEVAQKILSTTPDASYLSNFIQTYFEVDFVVNVSRERFYPVPKVDGAIIKLEARNSIPNNVILVSGAHPGSDSGQARMTRDVEDWSTFLHKAFEHPRKMLKKVFDEKILDSVGINPNQRPQEIELERWQNLFKIYEREKAK